MSDQLEILKDYRSRIDIPVAWGEMDAYGHVNNVVYFRYFETAQVNYFDQLGLTDYFRQNGMGAVIHKISCTYLIPLVYPDKLTVGVKVTEISKESLFMEFFLLSGKNGLSAFGESEMVVYDFASSKRMAIPEEMINLITKFETAK